MLLATAMVAAVAMLFSNWEAIYCRATIGPRVSERDFEWLGQSKGTVFVAIYGTPYSTETSETAMASWYAIATKSSTEVTLPTIRGVWRNSGEKNRFTLKIGSEFVKTLE
jgi:hypothetical protein